MISARNDRFDIQVMRGVAVLAVVLFHAFPGAFGSGFLGVDVFFVLSGFLITGIILRGLERGDFSFKAFYIRRAKRLLPASLTTLAVTTALAFVFLTRSQMADYAAQLLGSLAFVANFVLASQTGYFEGAAETKPLLHIWSLSLEEQFYFIAPLLLWLTPLRARPWLLISGMILSFALCFILMTGPSWVPFSAKGAQKLAFFMLPTRAWELLFGAVCAWVMIRRPDLTVPGWVKLAALAVIIATCAIGFDPVHPRWDAVIVVVATGLILLGKDGWLPRTPLLPVKIVGDWSYSLYLIHWPLFSFAYIAWGQHPPMAVMTGLALLATGLAWLQYRFVEQRFRGDWTGFRINPAWGLGAASAAIVAFAVPSLGVTSPVAEVLRPNTGLDPACDQQTARWQDIPACRTSDAPTVAVWGDSYAMHWLAGLEGLPVVQMTKSACAPVEGLAHTSDRYTAAWSRECVAFNDSVLAAIEAMPSVRYVLISSPFSQVFVEAGQGLFLDGAVQPFSDAGQAAFLRGLERLKAAGKVPIILAPTPRAVFDAGRCNERTLEGRPFAGPADCSISYAMMIEQNAGVWTILEAIGAEAGVDVANPAEVLCDNQSCRTRDGDTILYVDNGHLTRDGARVVVERLGLRARLGPSG
jgi:peptidoglycan/LPS O-acetylase OafA/YrhL